MNRVLLLILCAIGTAKATHRVIINAQCTGSIIHSRWILTSASCPLSPLTSQTSIAVGGAYYGIERVVRHQNFVPNSPNYDIALIRLTANLAFGPTVRPIVLNLNEYNDYRGLTVLVGNFQIIDESNCSAYTGLYRNLICTIATYSQPTTCPIPTGTPITWNNQLIGLEVGTNQCYAQTHMFTRISRYSNWLLGQLAVYGDQVSVA